MYLLSKSLSNIYVTYCKRNFQKVTLRSGYMTQIVMTSKLSKNKA